MSTIRPHRADPVIRDAVETDMRRIQAIYAHYVLTSLVTFEEVPPSVEQMIGRRAAVLAAGLPYLVAEHDGDILGYAYATAYRARPAYRHTVEDSVYVEAGRENRRIGTALLERLIAGCERGPFRQMVAVIGDSANRGSIALHRRLGFRDAGVFEAVGFKFGRWVDTVQMQRALGEGARTRPDDPGPSR